MSCLLLVTLAFVVTTGCGHMFSNAIGSFIRDKKYIIVKDVSGCSLEGTVSTWYAPNSQQGKHSSIAAILVLKKEIAESKFNSVNAVYNIHMTDKDFPLARADVYKCSDEKIEPYKELQRDKEYLYSLITYDLKKEDMPTKPPR